MWRNLPVWKKVLVLTGSALLLLVLALALAPLLLGGAIRERVRAAIDDAVDADVAFGDTRLGLFRSFPNASLSVDDLSVVGVGAFVGDTLVAVPRLRLVLDLGSVIGAWRRGDPLVVRSIDVERPYVHLQVLADGAKSWDVLRADSAGPEPAESGAEAGDRGADAGRPIRVALRRLTVTGGRFTLDDAQTSTHVALEGLDHTLVGDFGRDRSTMETRTVVGRATVEQLGVAYLPGARVELDADLDADLVTNRFTLRENRVRVNELGASVDGGFGFAGDRVDLDLAFAADEAAFRDLLSMVPAIYRSDFADIDASGRVALSGRVAGAYGPEDFPAFSLDLDVTDGSFRYPDQPVPATGIAVELAILNPGGHRDSTTVRLDRFDVMVGADPFHASGRIATPFSDPEIEIALNGRIDLGAIGRLIALEGIDELRGVVTTDASAHTRLSWLENEEFDRVSASGGVEATALVVRGDALRHPIEVDELRLDLNPRMADLHALRARIGGSDVEAVGSLENLLGFLLYDQDLRGSATIRSDALALDEWRSGAGLHAVPIPSRIDMSLSGVVGRLTLGTMEATAARGTVHVRDRRVTLEDVALETLGGEVVVSGWYETLDAERPTHDLDLEIRNVDLAGAFRTFNTIRAFAPVAEHAAGRFSARLETAGPLGADMSPVLGDLSARGSIQTVGIGLSGVPALDALANALRVDRLRDPGLQDFAASVEVRAGRLHVSPFDVRLAGMLVSVTGSNGLDRSLDYRLGMEVPRDWLGGETNRVVGGLIERAGRVGIDLGAVSAVRVDATVGGTLTAPTVGLSFGGVVGSEGIDVRDQVEQRLQAERDRAESEARAAASARADSLIADAEARVAVIRVEAERLAEGIRAEGANQADRLVAEATSPLARQAARLVADRVRSEADARARAVVDEANRRADQLMGEARASADRLRNAPAP